MTDAFAAGPDVLAVIEHARQVLLFVAGLSNDHADEDVGVRANVPPAVVSNCAALLEEWNTANVEIVFDTNDAEVAPRDLLSTAASAAKAVPLHVFAIDARPRWTVGLMVLGRLLELAHAGKESDGANFTLSIAATCGKLAGLLPSLSPLSMPKDFSFIDDETFARVLRDDAREMRSAFAQGNWKCVLVMAGSLVEATLLKALCDHCGVDPEATRGWYEPLRDAVPGERRKKIPSLTFDCGPEERVLAALGRQRLQATIALACAHDLIDEELRVSLDQLREWRNLVHPTAANRKSAPTCGMAQSAVASRQRLQEQLHLQRHKARDGESSTKT